MRHRCRQQRGLAGPTSTKTSGKAGGPRESPADRLVAWKLRAAGLTLLNLQLAKEVAARCYLTSSRGRNGCRHLSNTSHSHPMSRYRVMSWLASPWGPAWVLEQTEWQSHPSRCGCRSRLPSHWKTGQALATAGRQLSPPE